MTATQRFIEDAIKGGYGDAFKVMAQLDLEEKTPYVDRLLLDPKAWEAVGKVRGWAKHACSHCGKETTQDTSSMYRECPDDGLCVEELFWDAGWKLKQHRFIDHLADNKNIEEALQAIE